MPAPRRARSPGRPRWTAARRVRRTWILAELLVPVQRIGIVHRHDPAADVGSITHHGIARRRSACQHGGRRRRRRARGFCIRAWTCSSSVRPYQRLTSTTMRPRTLPSISCSAALIASPKAISFAIASSALGSRSRESRAQAVMRRSWVPSRCRCRGGTRHAG